MSGDGLTGDAPLTGHGGLATVHAGSEESASQGRRPRHGGLT